MNNLGCDPEKNSVQGLQMQTLENSLQRGMFENTNATLPYKWVKHNSCENNVTAQPSKNNAGLSDWLCLGYRIC